MDEGRADSISRSWFGHAGDEISASGVAELSVALPAGVDLAAVPRVFGRQAQGWLGSFDGADASGLSRYICDLELRVSPEGRGLFRKAAVVSLGAPVEQDDGWRVPIEWRAATLAPLFPVFAGWLSMTPRSVALTGSYAPPLGIVGQYLDRALLSIAARGTGRWFLSKVVAALAKPQGERRSQMQRSGALADRRSDTR
jgi:hypothetical protein